MRTQSIAPPLAGNILGSTDCDFLIAEWEDEGSPPGPPLLIAPLHIHHADDEAWYVLEGTLCVQIDENQVTIHAGCGVYVPKGARHTYWNPNPTPCRYLLFMTANVNQLIDSIHTMEQRTPEAMAALFKTHNSTYLGWGLHPE